MKRPRHGGGWHSVGYTLKTAKEVGISKLSKAMLSKNTCKTCALGMGGQKGGMRNEAGHFPEFCKKSLQAQASDIRGPIPAAFFQQNSIEALANLTPRQLDRQGRLHQPLLLSPLQEHQGQNPKAMPRHYQPISWSQAYDIIANQLKTIKPEEAFFYFSGRSSNEAGFLLQLFCRQYGTNHVNNCSFYCHQASGVGLKNTIGSGTSTIALEDLSKCDLFFLIGGNPASNHPRLLSCLKDLRRRGGHVIVINPAKEVGLERFSIPSDPRSLVNPSKISSLYLQPHIGGDIALLMAIAKIVVAEGATDQSFIQTSTSGFQEFAASLERYSLDDLATASGVAMAEITKAAHMYIASQATVFSWTMGITHHIHGVANVETIANLALLRGMVGRAGAGLLPIRGHSNVQGMGSMGVVPTLAPKVIASLETLGLTIPQHEGFDTMRCMEESAKGKLKLGFCLGGNLYGSNPDLDFAKKAMNQLDTVIYLSTTLNTGHTEGLGKQTIILPVLARDEERQSTTQESMFNFVRLSDGGIERLEGPRSETEIICEIADRVVGSHGVFHWNQLRDHQNIRNLVAKALPEYEEIAQIGSTKREFHIKGRVLHQARFPTSDGLAHFAPHEVPDTSFDGSRFLKMMSIRSEGQFNTVVYEEEDAYRGQDRRDIILMNTDDMKARGFTPNQKVTVKGPAGQMNGIHVRDYPIKRGAVMMYYPEVNQIISRQLDPSSKTPAFKAVLVEVVSEKTASPLDAKGGL